MRCDKTSSGGGTRSHLPAAATNVRNRADQRLEPLQGVPAFEILEQRHGDQQKSEKKCSEQHPLLQNI